MARSVFQYEQPRCPDNWNEAERRFYNRLIETLDDIYSKYGRLDEKMLSKGVLNRIDNSTATSLEKMTADILSSGKIAADSIEATFAYLVSLSAKYGSFDFETVKNLVADAMVLEKGQADYVHITNLAATYAQAVNATIGNLVIQSSDGKYYQLDVSADGKVSAKETTVTDGEIAAGETSGGKVIVGTHITAETLGTATLAATQALINMIDASRINVDTLVAREEFVQTLTANEAFVDSLVANTAFIKQLGTTTIVGDKSLTLIASEASDAKSAANSAQAAANAAQTAANSAQSTANNAQASVDDLNRLTDIEVIEGTFVQATRREGEGIHVYSEIKPKQDKTYGDPYPGGAGKNKLKNTATTQTINGVTFTVNSDGSVTANGTATDVVFFNVGRVMLESGIAYILSGCPDGGNNGGNFLMYVNIGSEFYYDFGSSVSFEGTGEERSAFIQVKSGATVNATFYPMIRLASDPDASYTPYANTPPIEGWTGLNAFAGGKNLCNLAFSSSVLTIEENADGTITATNNTTWDISGPKCELTGVLPAGTYTISKYGTKGDVYLQTSSSDYSNSVTTLTFNYDGVSYLRILCSNIKAGESVTYKIQIETGSATTPYTPYTGKTYALDFGETVYGGRVNWNTGELMVKWGFATFDGSESYTAVDTDAMWCRKEFKDVKHDSGTTYSYGRCTHAPTKVDGGLAWNYLSIVYATAPNMFTFRGIVENWKCPAYTVDAWKAFLAAQKAAGTPVQVAYELAEPYTIQLTPVQIESLEGINTVYTDADGGRVEFGHKLHEVIDSTMPPASATVGTLWLDRSVTPAVLRRYNGGDWEAVNDMSMLEEVQSALLTKQAELEAAQRESALFLKLDAVNKVVRIGQVDVTSEFLIDAFGSGVSVNNEIFSRFEANRVVIGGTEMRKPVVGGLAFDSIKT